ncbi:nitroreductase family protein [Tahibacter amnicola]|uniref:Putative NAD(P)H nitroreductase n=1 Tax=Tahibacter amnicola TaxID=2976241 RepID=A0ABY6BEE3_9GAMM|nr:nitroreductase [Tahibacter amnicola]UXI67475.1 nitroreductase [Tahibacter amnicola]
MRALQSLNERRSVPSRLLGEPGPSAAELESLIASAIRVPDHGKLTPWRLILIRGDQRRRLGELLVATQLRRNPETPPAVLDKDRQRFNFAPLIIAVVARVEENHPKIPAQEQLLSAGCVAYNLLLGAQALGYGAQWLTGWAAYDADIAAAFALAPGERIISFIHIGTASETAPERLRPAVADVTSEWTAPE